LWHKLPFSVSSSFLIAFTKTVLPCCIKLGLQWIYERSGSLYTFCSLFYSYLYFDVVLRLGSSIRASLFSSRLHFLGHFHFRLDQAKPKRASTIMTAPCNAPLKINILTLNCWGLKYIAQLREERLEEIGRRLATATPTPEIVGLQECWTQQDYQTIREHTRHILPYGKFYYSGIFGGGLAILSKWPIEESSMVRYTLNGRPTAFFRGDWYVGKGVACARIRLGPRENDVAEVFCTHLHAPYEREPNDSYLCHRTAQAWEITKLMRGAAERGHLVIGLGDFNMTPLSFAHQLITAHAPVRDVWRVVHPDSSLGAVSNVLERNRGRKTPTAKYNITENGATCDSALNTWRWSKQYQKRLSKGERIVVDGETPDPRAKRLDYIFIGNGTKSAEPTWDVENAQVGMTEPHPTLGCSLSDHFSVEATIACSRDPPSSSKRDTPSPSNESLPLMPPTSYAPIEDLINTYMDRERSQRRWRLGHFIFSLWVSCGCIIATWWVRHPGLALMLTMLSTLNLAAGLVNGLIGGLFMSSEIRALKEFEWEIENAKAMAEEKARGGSKGGGRHR
jgi:sphingomyelin phosphodiesterase 2